MPPRIVPILDRLRQDIAAQLTREAIEQACRQARHTWRERLLDPATTVYLFLLQVLHGNTACRHVVHFGGWSFTDSAYCQARRRLPLAVLQRLLETTAATLRDAAADASRWLGHRVWLVDGSGFSMPDTPELLRHFGRPAGQAPGCGFPVAKWLALFDLASGMPLRCTAAPLRTHDMARAPALSEGLEPGDVVPGDRGFGSYAHLAVLLGRRLHGVFRVHHKRTVDFTPGRRHTRPGADGLPGLAYSRWLRALGEADQLVAWPKSRCRPPWLTPQQYAELPEEITVRELRYRVGVPGYRVREVTLVTTLTDAAAYPASELAELYYRRWQVETCQADCTSSDRWCSTPGAGYDRRRRAARAGRVVPTPPDHITGRHRMPAATRHNAPPRA